MVDPTQRAATSSAQIVAVVPQALRPEFFASDSLTRLDQIANTLLGDRNQDTIPALEWIDGGAQLSAAIEAGQSWPEAKIVVVAWGMTPFTEGVLDAFPALRLVAHTGATVRPFVTEEMYQRGIQVTQAGEGMARSVAEVALSFTLSLLHQTHRFDFALRTGEQWEAAEKAPPRHEILNTPIGVVGASRTGRSYIEVVRALGAQVLVYDPFLSEFEASAIGVAKVSLDDLLQRSRIVAIHAPSLPETRHMIGLRELALMHDGAGLVNTARSWLVDENALLNELATGRLDAALDVFDAEPLPVDHPFRGLHNVLLTPHHAAGSVECRLRQGGIVVDEIERFALAEKLQHTVSQDDLQRMA